MAYVEIILWLLLIVFCGVGVFRLLSQMVPPVWLNWLLLPATVVSEMAYIFGCLITGGEIRHAKLIGTGGAGAGPPATEAAPKLRFVGPLIASLLAMVACGAAIAGAHWLLGEPVMDRFRSAHCLVPSVDAPSGLASWPAFWARLEEQLRLLRRMCETLGRLDWLDWHSVLFVYLAACLSIRLAPVGRDMRASLAAAGVVALGFVLVGAVGGLDRIMAPVGPIVTYVWGNLLLLLAIALLARGLVAFVQVLRGKSAGGKK
jgi:hypothetical protein